MFKRGIFLTILLLLLIPLTARAQIGVNVYEDVVYDYLDKLVSARLVKTYSPNQKPYSRYAVAKMVVEADKRIEEGKGERVRWIVRELEKEFAEEISYIKGEKKTVLDFKPLDKVHLLYTTTDQPEESMPANGLGTTGGRVQPLLSYKNGRHFRRFANFHFDVSAWLQASPYFAAYIQPEFYYTSPGSGQDLKGGARLYRSYLKSGYKNFEFEFGRDSIWWGPGENSLMFSKNARAQDMIRLTNPSTFRLPWYFSYIGQWKLTGFWSWLGTKYSAPNAILSGYRVDLQPLYWIDLGFDHMVTMGGKGARDPSVKTAIGEYIGFVFDSGNSKATSNHQMGADLTFSIPPLRGLQFYGKIVFEDTNNEDKLMFIHNASYLAGAYLPDVIGDGRLSVRGEFITMGEYAYRHSFYTEGFSLSNKFLGYDSGSDTYSGVLKTKYIFNSDEYIDGGLRYLKRSSNTYRAVRDATGNQTGLAVNQAGTKEYHYILKVGGQKRLSKMFNLYGELGLDYTKNKFFRPNKNALDFAFQLMLTIHNF